MALVVADVAGGMKEAEAREAEATAERSWSARASRRRRDGTVRRWLRDLREVAETLGRRLGEPPAHAAGSDEAQTVQAVLRRYCVLLAGGGCGKKLGKSDLL